MKSRWKRKAVFVCAALLLLLAVSGMFLGNWPFAQGPAKMPRIIYIYKTTLNEIEFWRSVSDGIEAGAKEYGAQYNIWGPRQESDIDGNIEALRRAIAMKPDAIVLAAADYYRLAADAQRAVDEGILLLTLDSDVSGGLARCFIGTDNHAAGRQMGEELSKRIPNDGQVGIVGHVAEANTTIERIQGATEVLEAAGCEVLQPVYCNNLSSEAQATVRRMLLENPNIAGFIATNELAAKGMAAALAAAGLQDSVASVTCDHSTDQIAYLEQGAIDATVVQKPFNMGYFSVQIATELLANPENNSIPAVFDTGIDVITQENYFTPENQKLLFPLWE